MKQRFIVEVESTPMDEDGDLEDLSWYLHTGLSEHYEVSCSVITALPNQEEEADREWANNWHRENCSEDGCQASGSFEEQFPCTYEQSEPEEDHGISLSSYG